MLEELTSYALAQKHKRINRIVVLVAIITNLTLSSAEVLINFEIYRGPAFFIYLGFIAFCIVTFILYLIGLFSEKLVFLLVIYRVFLVLLIPDLRFLNMSGQKFDTIYIFQGALFCVIFVAMCSCITKGIHPFLVTAFYITAITYAAISQNDSYINNKHGYFELLNHVKS